ncbi:TetR/AcrR family transcriptional regulator [Occultella gossypii]|uniref:TetR/AcrR family transcriptional regulator n=1 Tax=Occultella gossypii TaxID=2800820 RepID=A0ABS7S9E6_9MICO|nr:TetR/AcrR family transcriptional regulator [Occultella gossypii]MBZ2196968.1 TetR/AcrR family transcriptional regulator [Occultella gossypii]
MGNREDLLAAAKGSLFEKGYTRTTARDLASAAGVSLSAIGYHFGSKDQLLTVALRQAVEEWSDDLASALAAGDEATPSQRFEETWRHILASFASNGRLWAVQFELLGSLDHQPELRAAFAEANEQAREALAVLVGVDVPGVGGLYHALIGGLAAQWLVDPGGVPTAAELRTAITAMAARIA